MKLFKRKQWEYVGVASYADMWYELYRRQTKSGIFRYKKVRIPHGAGVLVKHHNELPKGEK